MLHTAVCATLEKTVNFMLTRDADSAERLQTLEGQVIHLSIQDPALNFYWLFENQHVRIMPSLRGEADATISGPLQSLINMGLSKAKVAKDLTISGDMHSVEAFKILFAQLDIDWVAQLAPYTGDALAFKLHDTARKAKHWLGKAAASFKDNSKEYLYYEAQLLPDKQQVKDFSDDVRELNRDVDRVAARLRRLEAQN
jgi:ubiquinone biosynthesis protein UbiJ